MIAQSVALCIIAVCAILFGVGILRFILAWHRLDLHQQEAEFRAQCLLAESAIQLRGKCSTRASNADMPVTAGPTPPDPASTLSPENPLVAMEVPLRG